MDDTEEKKFELIDLCLGLCEKLLFEPWFLTSFSSSLRQISRALKVHRQEVEKR